MGQIGGATSGLWTLVSCSDGVTFNATGTDLWGAVYDGTKIIRAAAGTAHSHMTLRSQAFTAGGIVNVPFYMTIDFSTTQDYQCNFYFSKAAPTGGSITARPTSTDEWSNATVLMNSQAVATPKLNGWLATDGNFVFGTVVPGSGVMRFGAMFHVLSNTRVADPTKGYAGDLYPAFSAIGYNATWPFFDSTSIAASGVFQGRSHNGAAVVGAAMAWLRTNSVDPTATVVNTGDPSDGSYYELITELIVTTNGWYSIRGRFADIVAAVPGASVTSNSEPSVGAPVSQVIGNLWFPVNGVAVTF